MTQKSLGIAESKVTTCSRCGAQMVERPLALRCPDCGLLMQKPGIDYGDVMNDDDA